MRLGMRKANYPRVIRQLRFKAGENIVGLFVHHKGEDVFFYVAGSYENMDDFLRTLNANWRAFKKERFTMSKELLIREADNIVREANRC